VGRGVGSDVGGASGGTIRGEFMQPRVGGRVGGVTRSGRTGRGCWHWRALDENSAFVSREDGRSSN
jgi:hypothetical protein